MSLRHIKAKEMLLYISGNRHMKCILLRDFIYFSSSAGKESQCRRSQFGSWVRKIPWRRDRLPALVFMGFPGGLDGKESACNAADLSSTPGWGRPLGEGHGNPRHRSCLENPHGQRNPVGYNPRGRKELDMTEQLSIQHIY